MAAIRAADITLEICPTSNLLTKALADEDEVRDDLPHVRRARRAVHDRHGRPGDDAHPPARRVRAAARASARSTRTRPDAANARGHEASFIGRLRPASG